MGLGYKQGKYKIVSIDRAITGETTANSRHPVTAKDIIKNRTQSLPTNQLSFLFPSRLRLKHRNKIYHEAPPFQLIFERLAGRIKTLERAYGSRNSVHSTQLTNDQYEILLSQAKAITTLQHNMKWTNWDRFSGRQKEWMKFSGLLGDITYQGDMTPFLPYLALGEWVHIGGKTSFGLGKYILGSKHDGQ